MQTISVEEAKKKICPFIQTMKSQTKSHPNANDSHERPSNINCICGDCMAWAYTVEYDAKTANDMKDESDFKELGYRHDDGATWIKEKEESKKEGYCQRLTDG